MLQRVPINEGTDSLAVRECYGLVLPSRVLGAVRSDGAGRRWCIWYSLKNRARWDWRVHGMTVLVVSILTTPYEWFTDEAILLPAILQAAAWIFAAKGRTLGQSHCPFGRSPC